MSQINSEYYPKDRPFTEISVRFFGSRTNPRDVMCYLKLLSLSEKLGIQRPKYLVDNVVNIVGIEEIIPAEMIIDEPFPIP